MASSIVLDKRMKTDILGLPDGDRIHPNYGSPEEMEDKYLRLQEEHLFLKKHAVNQEDKLKKLTTKLTRLLNEKKKWVRQLGEPGNAKDVETEEMVQDLQQKIYELEKQNLQLKEKLLVARQQVFSTLKRKGPYQNVPSKVDTGRSKVNQLPKGLPNGRITNGIGIDGLLMPGQNIGLPPYAVTLLEDAHNEIRSLEDQVSSQRAQLEIYEQEVESINEQLKVKEAEYAEELVNLRTKLTQGKRQHVQENLDLIKLNREVKQKSSKLSTLEAHYTELEEKTASLRLAHDQLVLSLEEQQKQLEEERLRALNLQCEVNTSVSTRTQIQELQMMIKDLTKENEILKTSNEQLINSALDPERELHIQSQEESLKLQIVQLETVLKGDLSEKSNLIEHLKKEKERRSQMEEELKVLQKSEEQKKSQINELEKRMQFFTQESEVDFGELEEALALVQQRKRSNQHELSFLLKADKGQQQVSQQLKCVQAEKAETASELEKTRNMLLLQYKVSREAQEELERLKSASHDLSKEFHLKMEETSNLLDLRETRIQKLERQLRDIASGTKQSWETLQVNQSTLGDLKQNPGSSKSSHNIFEIRMHKVLLSTEGASSFGNKLPSLFITWVFYNYDLQSSSVIRNNKLDFNCSAQYEVELNANFLHYLSQEHIKVELHLSQGTNMSTVARTHLPLREVFDNPNGDHHKIVHLTGCKNGVKNLNYGTLHCNIVVPDHLEEAVILFKERLKAAGYLECNQRLTTQALEALDRPLRAESLQGVNELHVKVVRCRQLQARQKGCQPSPFCRYRFFQLSPQETVIIPASSNPEFNDHRTFSISMDGQLDTYLRTQKLQIFVFDEAELNKKDYIGKVSISLRKLLTNDLMKGSYSLQTIDGAPNGFVDMIIYWQFPYTFMPHPTSSHQSDTLQIPGQSNSEMKLNGAVRKCTETSSVLNLKENVQSVEETGSKCLLNNPSENFEMASTSGISTKKISKDKIRPASMKEYDEEGEEDSEDESVTSVSALNPEEEIGSSLLDDDESDLLSTSTEEEPPPPVEVVVVPSPSRKLPSPTKEERVVVSVNSLHLVEGAAILDDSSVNLLYVEYRFLDYSAEELETPFALPKPVPPKQILFNFRKVFVVNPKTKSTKQKLLLGMMNPATPKSGRLTFTIVSEPPAEQNSGECEDVGYAFVDFKKIFDTKQDILDEDIEVYDVADRKTILGYLNVRVEVIAVLKALSKRKVF